MHLRQGEAEVHAPRDVRHEEEERIRAGRGGARRSTSRHGLEDVRRATRSCPRRRPSPAGSAAAAEPAGDHGDAPDHQRPHEHRHDRWQLVSQKWWPACPWIGCHRILTRLQKRILGKYSNGKDFEPEFVKIHIQQCHRYLKHVPRVIPAKHH